MYTLVVVVRYIMVVKVSDSTGEAWFSSFNDEAEKIIGCSADELNKLRSEVRRDEPYRKPDSCVMFNVLKLFSPGR